MSNPSRQHLLPATFIAGFSPDTVTLPRRKRQVFVADRAKERIFQAKAEDLLLKDHIYSLPHGPAAMNVFGGSGSERLLVERWWTGIEAPLAAAIAELREATSTPLRAEVWLRTLVPFIASLLVRSSEYEHEFRKRFKPESSLRIDAKDVALGRTWDVHRLLAPICVADWIIAHVPDGKNLTLCDYGWQGIPIGEDAVGVAVTLDRSTCAVLVPRLDRIVMQWKKGDWRSTEEHRTLEASDVDSMNAWSAMFCRRFVICSSHEAAVDALTKPHHEDDGLQASDAGFQSGGRAFLNESMWPELLSATQRKKGTYEGRLFEVDTEFVRSGWHPIERILLPPLPPLPPDVWVEDRKEVRAWLYGREDLPFPLPKGLRIYGMRSPDLTRTTTDGLDAS